MARHYSTRDFFRQMPNGLLARYFHARGLFGELDFSGMKETQPEALFTAWLDLPDSQRNAMDAEFQDIFAMSCEKGFRAIIDEAEWHLSDDADARTAFVETLAALPNHYERAMARQFEVAGLKRTHWSSAAPIRAIFREAFEAAGLPYFNPHSLRTTLVCLGETLCQTPEEFKAWSQNLGHEGVLTTFYSYGAVGNRRQGEIIGSLGQPKERERSDADEIAEAVLRKLSRSEHAV